MNLVRFSKGAGQSALGVQVGDEVVDLSGFGDIPDDVSALLRLGSEAIESALARGKSAAPRLPAAGLEWLPLSVTAGKIICLGLNYVDHAAEGGKAPPTYPMVFFRAATSLVGHGAALARPACSDQFDYEGELVAFVGRTVRNATAADALQAIAGYSIFNDGSVRDYQRRTSQWTVGKNFDRSGGFGPAFVPAAQLPPGAAGLRLETRLNGRVLQQADTRDMVFDVAQTVVLLSECMTLEAGDVLVMGTPGGVGVARNPPVYMAPGDVCEVEIEGLGTLRNPVVQA